MFNHHKESTLPEKDAQKQYYSRLLMLIKKTLESEFHLDKAVLMASTDGAPVDQITRYCATLAEVGGQPLADAMKSYIALFLFAQDWIEKWLAANI